jgi:hypothetical protein
MTNTLHQPIKRLQFQRMFGIANLSPFCASSKAGCVSQGFLTRSSRRRIRARGQAQAPVHRGCRCAHRRHLDHCGSPGEDPWRQSRRMS